VKPFDIADEELLGKNIIFARGIISYLSKA
jgi:hypothetical protein